MEMNGEQKLKKMKRTPRWIIWMYVICILVIIGALGVRYYRTEVNKSEPIDFTTNGAVGMNSGIFNNPFILWGRYKKKLFNYYLTISFQYHHTQMDGAHAGKFLANLQKEIYNLK